MKKIFVGAALAVALALGAGPAHAVDPTEVLLQQVHALGFTHGSDANLIKAGAAQCIALARGLSVTQLKDAAETDLAPMGYTAEQADLYVDYAISDLCPIDAKRKIGSREQAW